MTRHVGWRRVLIYTHRWLGIAGCLLFVFWFTSGVVMMYARMPRLSPDERLDRLPSIDPSTVRIGPAEAVRRHHLAPQRARLAMWSGRPVYRFLEGRTWRSVFADSGERVPRLDAGAALLAAREFAPGHAATTRYDAYLRDSDQWTLSGDVRALMPLHRVALGDPAGTRVYVVEEGGEVVMKTTARERRWGYLGAVIHWIYFTPFRRQAALWTEFIIWSSIAGCLMCMTGIVWGVWRYSPRRRYRLKRVPSRSPYAGMMRWHHYAGLVFGVVTFTWILSGLLSMNPWTWSPGTSATREQREAVAGGPLRLEALGAAAIARAAAAIGAFAPREIEFIQFQGEAFLMAHRTPHDRRLVSLQAPERGAFERFDEAAVVGAARRAMPGAALAGAEWIRAYDAYYYSRSGDLPLPVLRVRYADAAATWLYLDPRQGAIVRKEERISRVNRWLYHGLHSFDFPFLYYRRPLWDIVVIALSVGGIVSSVTALTPAWRRLRRHARRVAHSPYNRALRRNT